MPEANGNTPLQRDNLFRAVFSGVELRAAADETTPPTMVGEFAVFDQWTEINSMFEGNFMERFSKRSFRKTIAENRDEMRVLFQHGHDPQIGDKPLGVIADLRETDTGARYEVPLLDAAYVRDDVLPGLQAGLYGASFRFKVMREEIVDNPDPSEYNPNGIPERTVKEAQVREFGPVTFPAYKGASAGVRCVTDDVVFGWIAGHPERLRDLAEFYNLSTREKDEVARAAEEHDEDASSDSAETETSHPADGRRESNVPIYGVSRKEEVPSWRLS